MKKIRKSGKLLHGVGINDANYNVHKYELVNGEYVLTWTCPFYRKWTSMLGRCYSATYKKSKPTYEVCTVIPEWHYFMTFRAWMVSQDWEGRELDKDLLDPGNKIYGPETCVFVDSQVNSFITVRLNKSSQLPRGTSFHKASGKFVAYGNDLEGRRHNLGLYENLDEAASVSNEFKRNQAKILADLQSDCRIRDALISMYF